MDRIKGKRTARGFEVESWPKPRVSNPNFLTELLEDWRKDEGDPNQGRGSANKLRSDRLHEASPDRPTSQHGGDGE